MKILLAVLCALIGAVAFAQSVPNGGAITQGQIWTAPQWNIAWQSKADTVSPRFTGAATLNGISIPTTASPAFTGTMTLNGVSVPNTASPAFSGTATIAGGVAIAGGTGACTNIAPQGHANWNVVQTCLNYNPTEWQVYGAQGQGKAHCDNPGVTGVVDWDSGTAFTSAWTGRAGFYMDSAGGPFVSGVQTVSSVASATVLTLSSTCTGSGSVTFHFVTTTNDGLVNVNGTAVTWVSGQLFNNFATGANQWSINGAPKTCSSITSTSATCNTSGTASNLSFHTDSNINDEVATLRLQKVLGANEENLTCSARAVGAYECEPQFTGSGTLWPFFLGNGNFSFNNAQQRQVAIQPNGDLTLGGTYLQAAVLIPAQAGQFSENFFQISPGLSTTGTPTPSIATRKCGTCADTQVSMGFDVFGNGTYTYTSHSFANIEFQIFGVGGSSWVAVGSSAAAEPIISANGAASNISIELAPKGTGVVQSTGPVMLPAFTVAALPTCAAGIANTMAVVTDATAPTYNAALTGGSTVKIPVFCNGSAWTAH